MRSLRTCYLHHVAIPPWLHASCGHFGLATPYIMQYFAMVTCFMWLIHCYLEHSVLATCFMWLLRTCYLHHQAISPWLHASCGHSGLATPIMRPFTHGYMFHVVTPALLPELSAIPPWLHASCGHFVFATFIMWPFRHGYMLHVATPDMLLASCGLFVLPTCTMWLFYCCFLDNLVTSLILPTTYCLSTFVACIM